MLSSPNLPFLIGNDICRIARVRRILEGNLAPQFVRRILRDEEIQHPTTTRILRCIPNQSPQSLQDAQSTLDPSFTRAVEFMAGRFAAKEAVIKAHPHRRLTYLRIAILRTMNTPEGGSVLDPGHDAMGREGRLRTDYTLSAQSSGPLVALIKGEEEEGERDTYASVSISHDTEYATAVCLGINPTSSLILGSKLQ